jgi:hypothetical protein
MQRHDLHVGEGTLTADMQIANHHWSELLVVVMVSGRRHKEQHVRACAAARGLGLHSHRECQEQDV